MRTILQIIVLSYIAFTGNSQKQCKFSESVETNKTSFIQQFSTSKCLRVSGFGFLPLSKVVLGDCSYWSKSSRDQKFTFAPNSLNKLFIKTDAGNNETFCLTIKKGNLYSDNCQSQNFDQSWTVKPVKNQKEWFLLEQYSSKKCLIPTSLSSGAAVGLAPCNSYQTEQIWKLCS